MKRLTQKQQSFIIGIFLGVTITIASFFIYLNLLSVSVILSGIYSTIVGLGIAVIISIVGFFRDSILKFYHYFKQSKIKLVIENAEFIAKGFDHSCSGYQLKVAITNKGRMLCPNLDEASIEIKDLEGNSPNLIKLTKLIGDKTEVTLQEEKMKKLSYCLLDKKNNVYDMKGIKLDDPYFMYYPCENIQVNLTGKKMNSAFSYSDYLLDLQDKEYSIEIKLRYISDKVVVPVTKTFNKKPPFATLFTTTKDPELSAFKLQTDGLRNRLSASENNLLNKESEAKSLNEKIKDKESEILGKKSEIQQLVAEKRSLNNQILQRDQQIQNCVRQMEELSGMLESCRKDNEELKNPSKNKPYIT